MSPRAVGVLFVAAVLVTGYCLVFEQGAAPWVEPIGRVFTKVQYADLEAIEIIPGSFSRLPGKPAEPVVLIRGKEDDGSAWRIEKPPFTAFLPRVESIAYELVDLQAIGEVPATEADKTFDARGPEVSARFRTRDGEEHRLEVGKDHPTLDLCYVKVDGRRLILARRSFRTSLTSNMDDLRSRALFPVPRERAAKLEVLGDDKYRKIIRRETQAAAPGGESWRFEAPQAAPGNREAIAKALDELNAWGAESFVRDEPGDLQQYGLSSPRATIAVTDRQGRRRAVLVGAEAGPGLVYVKWEDQPYVMTASAAPLEVLERPAEVLYSETVLQLGAAEVVEAAVVPVGPSSAKAFTLRRAAPPAAAARAKAAEPTAAPEWTVEEAGGARIPGDRDRARAFVDQLALLPIKRYLPPGSTGAPGLPAAAGRAPAFEVRLLTDAGSRAVLTLERPLDADEQAKKIVYVSVEGEPFQFQVVTAVLDDLAKGAARFRNRRISLLDPESVREVEIMAMSGGALRIWTVARPNESWRLYEQGEMRLKEGKDLDEFLVRKAVRLFGQEDFQVLEWMPEEKDLTAKEISPDKFRIRIAFTEVAGEKQGFRRLYLGARQRGIEEAIWAWCDAPDLKDLPFLLDHGTAQVLIELVDHLDAVTEPAR